MLFEEVVPALMSIEQLERTFDLMTALPCSYMHINCTANVVTYTF
jgi:hypothetical protein